MIIFSSKEQQHSPAACVNDGVVGVPQLRQGAHPEGALGDDGALPVRTAKWLPGLLRKDQLRLFRLLPAGDQNIQDKEGEDTGTEV